VFGAGGFPEDVPGRIAFPVVAVAVAWLAFGLAGRTALPRLGRDAQIVAAAAVALLVLTAASIAWSASGQRSWTETNRLVVYLALGTLGALVVRATGARAVGALVGAVFGAALAWALLGRVVPSLGPNLANPGDSRRLDGTIGYANGLALVAAMAVPIGLWATRARARWAAPAGLVLVVLAIAAAPLTYSRSGVALVVGGGVVWIACARSRFRALVAALVGVVLALPAIVVGLASHSGALLGVALAAAIVGAVLLAPRLAGVRVASEERVVRSAAFAFAALVLLGFVGVVVHDGGPIAFVRHRWAEFATPRPGSETATRFASVGSYRWSWWKEAFHGFVQRPLGGHGAGSFALTHLHFRKDVLSIVQEPHSMPLQLLTELGLAGFLLASLLVWALFRIARGLLRLAGDERETILVLVFVVAIASIHALVDLDWEVIAIEGVPVFVAGALVGLAATDAPRRLRPLATAGAVLALGAAAYSVAAPLLASRALAGTLTDPAQAYTSAALARSYDPLSVDAVLRQASAAHEQGDDDLAHRLYVDATKLEPENPHTWDALGMFEWHIYKQAGICSAYHRFNREYTEDPASAGKKGPLDRTRFAVNHGACS
jgi:hypothetical protein